MKFTDIFETDTCSRCGGSGNYSFNLMHGSRCYGCAGAGVKLTKRGIAARDWFIAQRSKPAEEIRVGERIYLDMGLSSYWVTVDLISVRVDFGLVIEATSRKHGKMTSHVSAGQLIPVAVGEERLAEIKAAALEYQKTLTKEGRVSKRSVPAG